MLSCRFLFSAFTTFCAIADAAKLVPIPAPQIPLAVGAFEVNKGQAKPEILFLARGGAPVAFTAQSILFSPLGNRQNLIASNSNPEVRYSDPLPGVVNTFTGSDTRSWITGIQRYATARFVSIYPGIDAEYTIGSDGAVTMKFILQPGVDPAAILIELPTFTLLINSDGSLASEGSVFQPRVRYNAPTAFQDSGTGRASIPVSFEIRQTEVGGLLYRDEFGFRVTSSNPALPLQIEVKLTSPGNLPTANLVSTSDSSGNLLVAQSLPDAAGKDAPYSNQIGVGCGNNLGFPLACSDIAVYKFDPNGKLLFADYLSGSRREVVSALKIAPNGAVLVTGTTESSDFPISTGVLQSVYAGPAATYGNTDVTGDYFAVRLDPATGSLLASTYLGGPNADKAGETAMGLDGSIYFLHKWLVATSASMPTSSSALQTQCSADPCFDGYAAHLSPNLDRLLYGTYLPGRSSATAKLHTDGSVYYAGNADAGFPTTPTAYQRQYAGNFDSIAGRLNPEGTGLIFATYFGGLDMDTSSRIAVMTDGSAWVAQSSNSPFSSTYRIVHLDAKGERILAERPGDINDLAADPDGNLLALVNSIITASSDAPLTSSCSGGSAYAKIGPNGEQLFATYLPNSSSDTGFEGTGPHGLPIVRGNEVVLSESTGLFAGCVVDAAMFSNFNTMSPGGLVTIFGNQLGPKEGAAFQLENGRVATQLAGTRVRVNGELAPLLYTSDRQINLILPYSLALDPNGQTIVEVDYQGATTRIAQSIRVFRAQITVFHGPGAPTSNIYQAAALNEDGTINSPTNPAKKGSRVVLFATGGGPTNPPSIAGEVTPLEIRLLQFGIQAVTGGGTPLPVEYAGAAPGLVAGVTQINIKLPDVFPPNSLFPRTMFPIGIITPGIGGNSATVTIAVNPD